MLVADLLVLVVDGDDDLFAGDQLHLGVHSGLHHARPDLGSLRVQRDADRHADVGGRLAHVLDRLEVIFVRPVREVHPRNVQACVNGHRVKGHREIKGHEEIKGRRGQRSQHAGSPLRRGCCVKRVM